MSVENIITFKNPSICAWLEEQGIKGRILDYVTPQDIVHRNVFGHIPYWLAAYAGQVHEVSVPKLSREDRERLNKGQLTVQELDAGGAYIASYRVRLIDDA
jgi:hypothetical protein